MLAKQAGDDGLLSLWEMLRRYASQFVELVLALETVIHGIEERIESGGDSQMPEDRVEGMFRIPIDHAREFGEQVGMAGLLDYASRIDSEKKYGLKYSRARELLMGLRERAQEGLVRCWFFYVQFKYAKLYADPLETWGEVKDKFQSAIYDVEEAGKSLALERPTATVFHLMRVLERGLRALANDLQIPVADQNPNWNEAIEQLEKRVTKQMPNSDPKAAHRKFYNEAILQFRLFKDAIRNYVVHEPIVYNQGHAEGHYNAVRDFMRHLATRLSE